MEETVPLIDKINKTDLTYQIKPKLITYLISTFIKINSDISKEDIELWMESLLAPSTEKEKITYRKNIAQWLLTNYLDVTWKSQGVCDWMVQQLKEEIPLPVHFNFRHWSMLHSFFCLEPDKLKQIIDNTKNESVKNNFVKVFITHMLKQYSASNTNSHLNNLSIKEEARQLNIENTFSNLKMIYPVAKNCGEWISFMDLLNPIKLNLQSFRYVNDNVYFNLSNHITLLADKWLDIDDSFLNSDEHGNTLLHKLVNSDIGLLTKLKQEGLNTIIEWAKSKNIDPLQKNKQGFTFIDLLKNNKNTNELFDNIIFQHDLDKTLKPNVSIKSSRI